MHAGTSNRMPEGNGTFFLSHTTDKEEKDMGHYQNADTIIAERELVPQVQVSESDIVHDSEAGATTAEYGIVMLAAVGFAGLLLAILKSDEVRELLMGIIRSALATGA